MERKNIINLEANSDGEWKIVSNSDLNKLVNLMMYHIVVIQHQVLYH